MRWPETEQQRRERAVEDMRARKRAYHRDLRGHTLWCARQEGRQVPTVADRLQAQRDLWGAYLAASTFKLDPQ